MQPTNRSRTRPGVSPRLSLGLALLLVLLIALLPRRPDRAYLFPTGVLLLLWWGTGMPVAYAIRRLVIAEFFILGIAAMSIFVPSSRSLFLSVLIKSNLSVLTLLLLTWTTPFNSILLEARRLRFPSIMITTLALMYRYFPVLAEESRRMQRARASRTFSLKRSLSWQSVATLVAHLFVRSATRAERIYLAMCARGWK